MGFVVLQPGGLSEPWRAMSDITNCVSDLYMDICDLGNYLDEFVWLAMELNMRYKEIESLSEIAADLHAEAATRFIFASSIQRDLDRRDGLP